MFPPKSPLEEILINLEQKIDELNWDDFQDQRVLIKGCSDAPIPTWAYLIITAHLSQKAKRIYFGELRQAIKIFNRDK